MIRTYIALLIVSIVYLSANAATYTENFDNASNWSGSFGSYAGTSYYSAAGQPATFAGGVCLRESSGSQNGSPRTNSGAYAFRMDDVSGAYWQATIASGGVGTFSVYVRRWDSSPAVEHVCEYSIDNGDNWTSVQTIDNAWLGSSDYKQVSGTINTTNGAGAADDILIRIRRVSGERFMVDDFEMTDYSVALPTCTAPSQATALTFGTVTTTSIAGSFTGSGADGYLVVRSTSSSLSASPSDATSYSAGNSLGGGTVVYSGSSTSFSATGLTDGTQYYFFVFAFTDNGTCDGGPVYATPALSDDETTVSIPACTAPSQATGLSFGTVNTTSIAGSFTGSGADGYLVVRSTNSTLSVTPTDAVSYSAGNSLGGGTVVYSGSSTSFTSSGLTPNTQYYFFVFAFTDNGTCSGGPVYATPALSNNTTTVPLATTVQFVAAIGTADEDGGTYVISVSITNPYSVATTADLVLVSGDATRINNYTTQSISFPANSSTSQTVTITLTDNSGCDGTEVLEFELQNVSGGYSASATAPSTHTLSLSDDDGTSGSIVYQGFESGDTWGYTLSTPDCNSSGDVWSVESSLGGITPAVGSNFWGIQDLNGNCGSSAGETITFDTENIIGISDVEISFQYRANGFDSGDDLTYTVTIDGVAQPEVTLVDGYSNYSTSGWETETISIPNGSSTVSLELFANQNGGSDYGGFDDVMLSGESCNTICTPPADPVGTISGTTPACNSTSLSFSGTAPGLAVYYWQSVTGGTATTDNAASALAVTTSGDYYVRAYFPASVCWSDGEIGPYSVTINSGVVVTTQPVNETVYTNDNISFTVSATGASSYQWQVDTGSGFADITNGGVYSNATTATLDITGTLLSMNGYEYRCVISGSPCADVNSSNAILTVLNAIAVPDNGCSSNTYASLTFTVPTSVSITDVNVGVKMNTTYRGDLLIKLTSPSGTEITIMNSVGGGADDLDVLFDDAGTANALSSGDHTVDAVYDVTAQVQGGGVSPLSSFNGENSAGTWTLRVCDDASLDLAYLLDFEVFVDGCTPTATVSSFAPTSGPVGTQVTITGTGFTGATAVSFNGLAAASYTVLNATTIIAELPTGATTGFISVADGSSCLASLATDFTVLDEAGLCGAGLTATELFISEVYDADAGDYHFIEIFNGTSSAINLSAYTVRINTGAITDIPLSNVNLGAGDTYLVATGNSSNPCAVSPDQSSTSGGFNGNDEVYLRKSGATIDYVPNPNTSSGFSQKRKSTVTEPTATYDAAEWTNTYIESCGDLGAGPYAAGPSISIDTEPVDVVLCAGSSINISLAATGSGTLSYQWKYNDGTAAGWTDLSTLAGVTVTGATSNSLTLTGSLATYNNYQFYCEVSSGSCSKSSEAVQLTAESRPIYRTIATGNWDAAIWEMADLVTGPWVSTCSYPTDVNSDEVIIKTGHDVQLNLDITIDKLTIETSGTLDIQNPYILIILD